MCIRLLLSSLNSKRAQSISMILCYMLRVNSLSSLPIQRKLCAASIFSSEYQELDVCWEIYAADQVFADHACMPLGSSRDGFLH